MKKILANDGIDKEGKLILESNGFTVFTEKVSQEKLIDYLNKENIDCILVRSATNVKKDIIDACPSLKVIGRAGVGMDNIDVKYAKEKGKKVINTPAASSLSVAELVFAHLFTTVRFLHDSNRKMPLEGDSKFNDLKKSYSNGIELKGKTLGIIGFGRIGQEVAKIAIGLGMNVIPYDVIDFEVEIKLVLHPELKSNNEIVVKLKTQTLEKVIKNSDFITVHVDAQKSGKAVIGKDEILMMKKNVILINTSRGGVIDEVELVNSILEKKVLAAGLDVFVNEPKPSMKLLMNDSISLTPHIGASTVEAQLRIGVEIANKIVDSFKN